MRNVEDSGISEVIDRHDKGFLLDSCSSGELGTDYEPGGAD